ANPVDLLFVALELFRAHAPRLEHPLRDHEPLQVLEETRDRARLSVERVHAASSASSTSTGSSAVTCGFDSVSKAATTAPANANARPRPLSRNTGNRFQK